ncbi:hypothetical protein Syun_028457 [Stephania yunnanensis]|uniref:Uncharacterized protein n=1 Tax=Stephania yunnanensis TaxID=152371 RepID=A0AAP0EHE1_9MAGN
MSDKVVGDYKGLMMKPITKSEVVEKVMLGLIEMKRSKCSLKINCKDEQIGSIATTLNNALLYFTTSLSVRITTDHPLSITHAECTLADVKGLVLIRGGDKSATLDDAEKAMLDLYCERAQIKDGHRILDLGCGYGAFAIHVASKYPHLPCYWDCDTTSPKSSSKSNASNVENTYILPQIHQCLSHSNPNDVSIVNHWVLNGKHISRTSEEWLKRLDDNADAAKAIIKDFLGSEYEAEKWINQWRTSYLHVVGDKGLMMKPTKGEVVEKLMLGLIPDGEAKMLIKDELQRRTDWIYSHNF